MDNLLQFFFLWWFFNWFQTGLESITYSYLLYCESKTNIGPKIFYFWHRLFLTFWNLWRIGTFVFLASSAGINKSFGLRIVGVKWMKFLLSWIVSIFPSNFRSRNCLLCSLNIRFLLIYFFSDFKQASIFLLNMCFTTVIMYYSVAFATFSKNCFWLKWI